MVIYSWITSYVSCSTSWQILKSQLPACDVLDSSFFPAATITCKMLLLFSGGDPIQTVVLSLPLSVFCFVLPVWLKNGCLFVTIFKTLTSLCIFVDNFVPVLGVIVLPLGLQTVLSQVQENPFLLYHWTHYLFSLTWSLCVNNHDLVLDVPAFHQCYFPFNWIHLPAFFHLHSQRRSQTFPVH